METERNNSLSATNTTIDNSNDNNNNDIYNTNTSNSRNNLTLLESKYQYIRHLILQYLICKDEIVKNHMENAIIKIFRYNEMEKKLIEDKKKNEMSSITTSVNDISDSLFSFSNMLSNFHLSSSST
jgi:hypothetical protein